MEILTELHDDLVGMAKEIASSEPNPERWDTPIIFLLDTLESEAMEAGKGRRGYKRMAEKVRDALSDWLEDGQW